jgi:sodium/pantothenate symporter
MNTLTQFMNASTLFAADAAAPPSVGWGAMTMLILFIAGSMCIGVFANMTTEKGGFMKGFFLGNRGLGAWALALTATIQSGGTFMGFPSLVYSHGWIVALWIGSYMVVPITGFGILGKRLAQLSRRTGAITVPDLFRTRFNSPALGFTCTIFILLYLSFMMFAQFKAGAIVIQLAWPNGGELSLSEDAVSVSETRYHIGLIIFAVTVVGYTLMGGFLAAVWTDLFQSLLMFVGVVILAGRIPERGRRTGECHSHLAGQYRAGICLGTGIHR